MEERRTGFWDELWNQLRAFPRETKASWDLFSSWAKNVARTQPTMATGAYAGAASLTAFLSLARLIQAFTEAGQASMVQRQMDRLRSFQPPPLSGRELASLQNEGYRVWKGYDGLWYRQKGSGPVEVLAPEMLLRRANVWYAIGALSERVFGPFSSDPWRGTWVSVDVWQDRLRGIQAQYRAALTPENESLFEEMARQTVWGRGKGEGFPAKVREVGTYFWLGAWSDPTLVATAALGAGAKGAELAGTQLGRWAATASRGAQAARVGAETASLLATGLRAAAYTSNLVQDALAMPFVMPVWLLIKVAKVGVVPVLRPVIEAGRQRWTMVWARLSDLTPRAQLLLKLRDLANLFREMQQHHLDPYILVPQEPLPEGEAGYLSFVIRPRGRPVFTDQEIDFYRTVAQDSLTQLVTTGQGAPLDVRVRLPQKKTVAGREGYPYFILNVPVEPATRDTIRAAVELITRYAPPGAGTAPTPPPSPPPTRPSPTPTPPPPRAGSRPPSPPSSPSAGPPSTRKQVKPPQSRRYSPVQQVRGQSFQVPVEGEAVDPDLVWSLFLTLPEDEATRALFQGRDIGKALDESVLVSSIDEVLGTGRRTAPAPEPVPEDVREVLDRLAEERPRPEEGPAEQLPLPFRDEVPEQPVEPEPAKPAVPPGQLPLPEPPPAGQLSFFAQLAFPVVSTPEQVIVPKRQKTDPLRLAFSRLARSLPLGEVEEDIVPDLVGLVQDLLQRGMDLPRDFSVLDEARFLAVTFPVRRGGKREWVQFLLEKTGDSDQPFGRAWVFRARRKGDLSPEAAQRFLDVVSPAPLQGIRQSGPVQVPSQDVVPPAPPPRPELVEELFARQAAFQPSEPEPPPFSGAVQPGEPPPSLPLRAELPPPPSPPDPVGEELRSLVQELAVRGVVVRPVQDAQDLARVAAVGDLAEIGERNRAVFFRNRLLLRNPDGSKRFGDLGRFLAAAAWSWRSGDPYPALALLQSFGYTPVVSLDRILVPLGGPYAVVISRATGDLAGIFRALLNLTVSLLRFPGFTARDADRLASLQSQLARRGLEALGVEQNRDLRLLLEKVVEAFGGGRKLEDVVQEGSLAFSVSEKDPTSYNNLASLVNGAVETLRNLSGGFRGAMDLVGLSLVRPAAVDIRVVAAADAFLHGNRAFQLLERAGAASEALFRSLRVRVREEAGLFAQAVARFLRGHGQVQVSAQGSLEPRGGLRLTLSVQAKEGEAKAFSAVLASLKQLAGAGKLVQVRGEAELSPDRLLSVSFDRKAPLRGEAALEAIRNLDPKKPVSSVEVTFRVQEPQDIGKLLVLFAEAISETSRSNLIAVGRRTAAKLARDAELGGLLAPEEARDLIERLGLSYERSVGFQGEIEGRHLARPEEGASDLTDEAGEVIKERELGDRDRLHGLSILYPEARDPQELLAQAPFLPLLSSSFLNRDLFRFGVEIPEVLPTGVKKDDLVEYAAWAYLGNDLPFRALAEAYGVPSGFLDEEGMTFDALVHRLSGLGPGESQPLLGEIAERVMEIERHRLDPFAFGDWELVDELEQYPSQFQRRIVRPLRSLPISAFGGFRGLRRLDFAQVLAQAVHRFREETDPFLRSRYRVGRALAEALDGDFSFLQDLLGLPVEVREEGGKKVLVALVGREAPEPPETARDLLLRSLLLPDQVIDRLATWTRALGFGDGRGVPQEALPFLEEIEPLSVEELGDLVDGLSALVLLDDPAPLRSWLVDRGVGEVDELLRIVREDLARAGLQSDLLAAVDEATLLSRVADRDAFLQRAELARAALRTDPVLAAADPVLADYVQQGLEAIGGVLERLWGEEVAPAFDWFASGAWEYAKGRIRNLFLSVREEARKRLEAALGPHWETKPLPPEQVEKLLVPLSEEFQRGVDGIVQDFFRRLGLLAPLQPLPYPLLRSEDLPLLDDATAVLAVEREVGDRIRSSWPALEEVGRRLVERFLLDPPRFWDTVRRFFLLGISPVFPGGKVEAVQLGVLPEEVGTEAGKLAALRLAWNALFGQNLESGWDRIVLNALEAPRSPLPPVAGEEPRRLLRRRLGRAYPFPAESKQVLQAFPPRLRELVRTLLAYQERQARIEEKIRRVGTRSELAEALGATPEVHEQLRVSRDWVPSEILRRLTDLLSRVRGNASLQELGAGAWSLLHQANPELLSRSFERLLGKRVPVEVVGETVSLAGRPPVSLRDPDALFQEVLAVLNEAGFYLDLRQQAFLYGKVLEPALPAQRPIRLVPRLEEDLAAKPVAERLRAIREELDRVYQEAGVSDPDSTPVFVGSETARYRNRIEDKLYVERVLGFPERGLEQVLFAPESGRPIAKGYDRIVYGDHGPYFEIRPEQLLLRPEDLVPLEPEETVGKLTVRYEVPGAPEIGTVYYQIGSVREVKQAPERMDLGLKAPPRDEGYADYVPGRYYIRVFLDNPSRPASLTTEPGKRPGLAPPVAMAQKGDFFFHPTLSNLAKPPQPLSYGGKTFPTAEHLYHYLRLEGTGREDEVLALADPKAAAKRAREIIRELGLPERDEARDIAAMRKALETRWDQDETFRKVLEQSGNRPIAVRGPSAFWDFPGENRLGRLLAELRDRKVGGAMPVAELEPLLPDLPLWTPKQGAKIAPDSAWYWEERVPVVTVNTTLRKGDGGVPQAVMGAGIAKVAAERDPNLPFAVAQAVLERDLAPGEAFYIPPERLPRYGLDPARWPKGIVLAATKEDWRKKSQTGWIWGVAEDLVRLAKQGVEVATVLPGAGLGGVSVQEVREIFQKVAQRPEPALTVLFTGSRHLPDPDLVRKRVREVLVALAKRAKGPLRVVEGGADGVDRIVREEAEKLGILVREYPATWAPFGAGEERDLRAGLRRNLAMLRKERPDLVVAFPAQAESSGTLHMVSSARAMGVKKVVVFSAQEEKRPVGEVLDDLFRSSEELLVEDPAMESWVRSLALPKVQLFGETVQSLRDLEKLPVPKEEALLALIDNSPLVRTWAREAPDRLRAALGELGPDWQAAFDRVLHEAVVRADFYEALGPAAVEEASQAVVLGELARTLVDAFRTLELRLISEEGARDAVAALSLEQEDIPTRFLEPFPNVAKGMEQRLSGFETEKEAFQSLSPAERWRLFLLRQALEELPALEETRRALLRIVQDYYAEGVGELALDLRAAGEVLTGKEVPRRAAERAARKVFQVLARGCELMGKA